VHNGADDVPIQPKLCEPRVKDPAKPFTCLVMAKVQTEGSGRDQKMEAA